MIGRPMMRALQLCTRCYATGTSTTPPMLLKIRKDLKTAMQNKDTTRLTVLRALLSQTLNASKTSSPIQTDLQLLSLLRKSSAASKAASTEFSNAGRQDLAEKEEAQIKIMEEYAGGVEVVGEDEIRRIVGLVVEGMKGREQKVAIGEVLKRAFGAESEGGFGEGAVERGEVARIVKEVLARVEP